METLKKFILLWSYSKVLSECLPSKSGVIVSNVDAGQDYTTRLISIVSKPIKVVVLVVVIGAVKKIRPKTFDPKKIHVKKR